MKLTHAPIVVSNQDTAAQFYTDVLGFEKRADYQQPGKPVGSPSHPRDKTSNSSSFRGSSRWRPICPRRLELAATTGRSSRRIASETTRG